MVITSFAETAGGQVEAEVNGDVWQSLSDDAGALAYRVLVEALTNIRRCASRPACPDRARVGNRGGFTGGEHEVSQTERTGRAVRGGRGLKQLAVLVAEAGGRHHAGPTGHTWVLRLTLPRQEGP